MEASQPLVSQPITFDVKNVLRYITISSPSSPPPTATVYDYLGGDPAAPVVQHGSAEERGLPRRRGCSH